MAQLLSILSSFNRFEAPRLIEIDDRGHPKCWATRRMSSALALPSVGADRSSANHTPVASRCKALVAAFGLTFTWMNSRRRGLFEFFDVTEIYGPPWKLEPQAPLPMVAVALKLGAAG